MDRGAKNTEVFPAAAMDGFTAARDVSSGSRLLRRAIRVSMNNA
jgi:hypothetical protein